MEKFRALFIFLLSNLHKGGKKSIKNGAKSNFRPIMSIGILLDNEGKSQYFFAIFLFAFYSIISYY